MNSASGTAAGNASSTTASAIQQTPKTLAAAATPAATAATTTTDPFTEMWFLLTGQTSLPISFASFVNGLSPFAGFAYNTEGLPYFSVGMGNSGVQIAKSTGQLGGAVAGAAAAAPKGLSGLGGMLGGGAAHRRWQPVWATRPRSASSSCQRPGTAHRPAIRHAASAIPVSAVSAVPEAAAGQRKPARRHATSRHGRQGGASGAGPRYGFKPTVMARPPFAG